MLNRLEALPFKGGYLILLKDYEALDASNFNYTGWAVFPNDCDVIKNETAWAKCVGQHLLRREEIKPYPVFYYKGRRTEVFYPLENHGATVSVCLTTSKMNGPSKTNLLSSKITFNRMMECVAIGLIFVSLPLWVTLRKRGKP